jgi:hypothetical protein
VAEMPMDTSLGEIDTKLPEDKERLLMSIDRQPLSNCKNWVKN